MKKRILFATMIMGLLLPLGACSDDDTPDEPDGPSEVVVTEAQMKAVIATYVDDVVIPTYTEMETKVIAMSAAVNKFISSGTQEDLDIACDAWRAARKPWEESEAFLYGPADYENLDPSLDSWPLDKDGLDQLLLTADFSSIGEEDPEDDDKAEEAQSLRGFHTLEYLLFNDGKSRNAEEMTTNEKGYAKAVSDRLLQDTKRLREAWVDGLGTEEVPTPFGEEMKEYATRRTGSARNVLGEFIISGGIQNISDEVGDAKIGTPYNEWKNKNYEEAVLQVESWYSWNSLTDYVDNIISIKNSYFGGRGLTTASANSLSSLVRLVDADLDTEVKSQIEATIKAIENIPAPFRSNLDATSEIEAAMEACADLSDVFQKVRTALDLY
ncbi:imelysin family protein [Parabacteroides sp. PF5-9]|uniref:imelysin family protein n=1 Tax=Parabacteroides sp. PF5-9 TaxID=1742404 RepID=UPI0024771B59|nr:imelysin family protein [Parabacteroides sp. PF5-9]MDH6359032.1 putative iron-regulated protein [Parabacteroides sp. PF5-9]